MIRYFRKALGKVLILIDHLISTQRLERNPQEQAAVDRETKNLSLYQFECCPFCIKVRRAMRRMSLTIELREVQGNEVLTKELVQQGGMKQVPCLRIEKKDGSVQWL